MNTRGLTLDVVLPKKSYLTPTRKTFKLIFSRINGREKYKITIFEVTSEIRGGQNVCQI